MMVLIAATMTVWLWIRYGLHRRETFEVSREKLPPRLMDRPRISEVQLQEDKIRRQPLSPKKNTTIKDVFDYLTDDLRTRVSGFARLEPASSVDYLPLLSGVGSSPLI